MQHITMCFRCLDQYCEVLREDVTNAEIIVERLVAGVLSESFDTVVMDDVSIEFPAQGALWDAPITISIRARGDNPLPGVALECLDCTIEGDVACVLVELFGSLHVESLVIG
jgi:hypothetical protein